MQLSFFFFGSFSLSDQNRTFSQDFFKDAVLKNVNDTPR